MNNMITCRRLRYARALVWESGYCRDQLEHGDLVSEASVEGWLHEARQHMPPDVLEAAKLAAEDTRQLITIRMERAERERDAVLGWIKTIPKEDVRASVFLHFIKGYSWAEISAQYFGGAVSGEGVRKACYRYIGQRKGKDVQTEASCDG